MKRFIIEDDFLNLLPEVRTARRLSSYKDYYGGSNVNY